MTPRRVAAPTGKRSPPASSRARVRNWDPHEAGDGPPAGTRRGTGREGAGGAQCAPSADSLCLCFGAEQPKRHEDTDQRDDAAGDDRDPPHDADDHLQYEPD